MKHVLSVSEERLLNLALGEYIDARRQRDNAKARMEIASQMHEQPWRRQLEVQLAKEALAASREIVRLTTEIVQTIRRY